MECHCATKPDMCERCFSAAVVDALSQIHPDCVGDTRPCRLIALALLDQAGYTAYEQEAIAKLMHFDTKEVK